MIYLVEKASKKGWGSSKNFTKRWRLRLAQNNGERERRAGTKGTAPLRNIGSI